MAELPPKFDPQTGRALRAAPPGEDEDAAASVDGECRECLELGVLLLASALASGREASLLRPFPATVFPSEGASSDDCDYGALRSCLATLPLLSRAASLRAALTPAQRRLLLWQHGALRLQRLPVEPTFSQPPPGVPVEQWLAPTHYFSVGAQPGDALWARLAEEHGVERLLHGSAFGNFHSILHNGLKNYSGSLQMRTGAAFGNGIYLSDSLGLVAQAYAPPAPRLSGAGWSSGVFGEACSAVAVCEVIRHPATLARREAGGGGGGGITMSNGAVPDKYWVVEDERHVRVVGLLLFADPQRPQSQPGGGAPAQQQRTATAERTSGLFIWGYVLVLVLIGLAQTPGFGRQCRRAWAWVGESVLVT
jgi:hypothetical protein